MKQHRFYEAPQIEPYEFGVEQGFAATNGYGEDQTDLWGDKVVDESNDWH